MRLLHTADWHLGDRLGRIDRTDDLRRAVERVAGYCDSEQVDVLIVAGDVFSELTRPDGLRDAVRHLQSVFDPFVRRGGTILAVTGNHDNENFCQTLRHAMTLAAPAAVEFGGLAAPGRLYLADEPTLLRLADALGGEVQFLLMPYPTPTQFLVHEPQQRYADLDEKRRFLQAAFTGRLDEIRASARYRRDAASVLVAHATVQGAQAEALFHLRAEEDVVCPAEAVRGGFAYVALGHIHKPHHLPGLPHVRYSGSVERMDLGEAADRKEVVLVELPAGTTRSLPLEATAIYTVAVHEPAADLPKLRQQHPDHARALVKLDIRYTAGRDQLEPILRELDAIFPRWYDRSWVESGALGEAITSGPAEPGRRFDEVVREYLEAELAFHTEAERAGVLARAERLLAEPAGGEP
jgi:exonuclease SbcD